MDKKVVISFFLLFAFSFLLTHNFIPHHHHSNFSEINHHKHQHHNSEKHHHKKEHNNKNENRNEKEPTGFYAHTSSLFLHSELSIRANRKEFKYYHPTLKLIEKSEGYFKQLKIPISHQLSYFYLIGSSTQTYYHSNSHRGPPSFS